MHLSVLLQEQDNTSDFRKLWPKSTAIPRRRSIKKKVQQWESKNGTIPDHRGDGGQQ